MISWDTITRLIVGRGAAERSEYRRLERLYKDAEASLKLVTEVTKASSTSSSTKSLNATSGGSGDNKPAAPEIHQAISKQAMLLRSLSAPAVASAPGADDEDELKRTQSEPNIREKRVPMPIMPEMTGVGKYCRAVTASESWQMRHLEQKLQMDGDLIVDFLGEEPPLGIDPRIWHEYRTTRVQPLRHSRTTSSITHYSSRTTSLHTSSPVTDASTEYIDPVTGTRVVRGFSSSNNTSAASSFKKNLTPITETGSESKPVSAIHKVLTPSQSESNMSECALVSDDEDDDTWEDMD